MDERGTVGTLEQGIALFAQVGMPARNLSTRTRKEYLSDLADLQAFLAPRSLTAIGRLSLQDLEAYQAEMDRRGYEPSTRKRKTYAIKTFFKFLHRQGITATNIAERLIPPPPRRREPRFLSEEEYQRLLRVCSHNPRDAAIVEVFLQTGMRLSELAGLKLSDLELPKRISRDPDNTGSARIRRKGGKEDTVPLNYKACQAIASYIKVRPKVAIEQVFLNKFKQPLSPRAIQYTIADYLEQVGIKNASVHTLRHTMATHHIARGTDIKTVQETLGHASLSTTTIYVSLAKKAQKKALQEHAL